MEKTTLILGGARSGKSAYAESLILDSGLAPVYFATASAGDIEMEARIAEHQRRRDEKWITVEEPLELPERLVQTAGRANAVLVDCLTMWLSNLMMAGRNVEADAHHLTDILPSLAGPVVFVSNEVGYGIVPGNEAARAFRDYQGALNQELAKRAESVVLVTAGIPQKLK